MPVMGCGKGLEGHGAERAYQVEEQPGCFITSWQALPRANVR